jgi:secondary thiamine-phosphate synthase enzyme
MIVQQAIAVETTGRGNYDITAEVKRIVVESGVSVGLCHVFIRHTSASLIVSENADPAVLDDLETFMARLVPDGDATYTHTDEGPDDMPSHVRSILTQTDLNVPITAGQCALGTWQGIFLWEHRHAAHSRQVIVTVQGN